MPVVTISASFCSSYQKTWLGLSCLNSPSFVTEMAAVLATVTFTDLEVVFLSDFFWPTFRFIFFYLCSQFLSLVDHSSSGQVEGDFSCLFFLLSAIFHRICQNRSHPTTCEHMLTQILITPTQSKIMILPIYF